MTSASATSKLTGLMKRATIAPPKMPEKLKGGRIERVVNFWKNLVIDYKEACQDIGKAAKAKPLKAGVYGSLGLMALYANKHNPNERSFYEHQIIVNQDLTMVPQASRNPTTYEWQADVTRAMNAGLLRSWNFGLFTIMWRADYAPEVGHVKAKCKYLEPGYLDVFTQNRIVDIGFCDRWLMASRAMKEYDVNPEEWDEQGRPKDAQGQLKRMW